MTGGIIVLLGIVSMVMIHEAGHFFAAKAFGMKATEFFFGFGPRLWSTTKGETEIAAWELASGCGSMVAAWILNLLGMARKSGQLVSGSTAVMNALRSQTEIGLVLLSTDISVGIAEKITGLTERQKVSCTQLLSKQELGRLLGKGERSAVAIEGGSLVDALLIELHRYTQMVREN